MTRKKQQKNSKQKQRKLEIKIPVDCSFKILRKLLNYYSFVTISKLFEISTENDKLILQNYFQKLFQRLNEAKDISNFNNDKEKQYKFQEYLCGCLNKYCSEGYNYNIQNNRILF